MLKEWLPKHLEANDDLTLEEHREIFEEFGEEISTSTIGRAIASLPHGGWPLKKLGRQSLLEQLFLEATEIGIRVPPEA